MTPEQVTLIVDAINQASAMVAGFIAALIFAVTWKG